MPAFPVAAPAVERVSAPFRIRHVLALAIVAAAGLYAVPRAKAAWALHAAATTFADYAQCMIGPTGPSLLRDDPGHFWRLARRRLITAPADARPFAECAAAAGSLTGSVEVEQAHVAPAWNFVEYGGDAAERAAQGSRELALADLRVTTRPLAELAELAEPFVRGGYTRLVRASSHAYEAPHPVELPRPAWGSGLPEWRARYRTVAKDRKGLLLAVGGGANLSVYRSADGGVRWRIASLREPGLERIAGRCRAEKDGTAFAFGFSSDGASKLVRATDGHGNTTASVLAPASSRVFAASCDADTLVAAIGHKGTRAATLHVCPVGRECRVMESPKFAGTGVAVRYPMDVARVSGVTVVATSMRGVVRVTSSRDNGASWMPWTTAYDGGIQPAGTELATPGNLLVIGDRLALYGGGDRPGTSYPTLFSDDHGASWRSP